VANVNGDPRATDHPRAISVALPSMSCFPQQMIDVIKIMFKIVNKSYSP